MVETWIGAMSGAKLVLLLAIQACTMLWNSNVQADNLPYDPGIELEFKILENSKLDSQRDNDGMLLFKDSKGLDSDVADLDDTGFVDAQWTVKPKKRGHKSYKNHNQNFKTKNHSSNSILELQKVNNDIVKARTGIEFQYDVGESAHLAPPISGDTGLDAPPLFDESEMDSESSVTESVTQQITTEMDFEATTDEDEMLRKMHRRWRRAAFKVTVTTQEPPSTTPRQDDCEGLSYWNPRKKKCSCPRGKGNPDKCDEDMNSDEEDDQDRSTVLYSGQAVGPYDNGDRYYFENEIWKAIKDIFPGFASSRVYLHPITYDPVTGLSNIQFDLIHNKNLTPLDIARLSSIVAQIMSNRLPLNVNGQQVLWLDTANLTVTEDDGTIVTVPVSVEYDTQICYYFDKLGTCKNGAVCVNETGEPVCRCTDLYHGKYCEVRIKYPDEEEDLLAILIPILVGMCGLVFLCSCCFLFARRANKGDEASSVSSVPPVALAVPKPLFRAAKFDPVRPVYMEEIWEERPVIEYERVMYEQILEPDNIFREPVYQYYVDTEDRFEERFETVSTSSDDILSTATSATRVTWMDDASKIGHHFHIDRPECSSSANSVFSDETPRYKNGINGKPGAKLL